MTDNNQQPNGYAIGYGKPPEHTRFKPGQSGNPKGRPKGSKNIATLVKEIWNKPVKLTLDGKPTTCSVGEAMLLAQANKAMRGDTPAFKAFQSIARETGHLVPEAAENQGGGVLLLPAPLSVEEWEKMMAEQKAARERGRQ